MDRRSNRRQRGNSNWRNDSQSRQQNSRNNSQNKQQLHQRQAPVQNQQQQYTSSSSSSSSPTVWSKPKSVQVNKSPQQNVGLGQTNTGVAPQPVQASNNDHSLHPSTELDAEADTLCGDVQCSLMRAIDSTHEMPLSEHVLYSSYDSYDNVMIEQRRLLDGMMNKLSECSDQSYNNQYGQSYESSWAIRPDQRTTRIDFNHIENLRDKYDTIHDFSELMFDKIGQNLDNAAGLTSRDAQLVQATLEAANRNRVSAQTKVQFETDKNLSSSSSSSSLETKQTIETKTTNISPAESNHSAQSQQNQEQQLYRYKQPQARVTFNQVNSVVQSTYAQNQSRNQFGGYFGKQQFGPPNQRYATLENKSIPRPQSQFKDKPDNSYRPFEPLIKIKPNANIPLSLNLERDEHGNEFYTHPYENEILQFQLNPQLFTPTDPIKPPELDLTPIVLVDNIQQLEEMCRHIGAQKEFAVDVEHHSYRSFQGITCLLQISTRIQDFVIDAIKLRSELYRLNESFTNPNIVKVFHGADCDILWLQRDFGVYVVNLFDTSRAAKLMKFAHLSLAFLMKHYCNFDPDKSYQLADWRERPLPLPMLQYARADTHYLLYIYDRLRNDLLARGGPNNKNIGVDLLKNVYARGREICLKRYEKPPFSEKSHLAVLRKTRSTFNAKQMFAFKELYAWRDSISRELDESVGYVLPNNLMIRIAEYLPREPQGITALCNPIPPTVKKYLSDIHAIILKAIDVPLEETSKVMTGNPLSVDPSLRSIDLESINHKQDIAHSAGMHETSVPNLLDRMYLLNCSSDEKHYGNLSNNSSRNRHYLNDSYVSMQKNQSPSRLYNFLDASWGKHNHIQNSTAHDAIQKQFVSPYNRYVARNQNN